MLHLARGAVRLEDWTRAEAAVRYSLEIAKLRNEADVIGEAESLLEITLVRAAENLDAPAPASAHAAGPEALASELVSSLEALAPAG
jgi:hypothetical protein